MNSTIDNQNLFCDGGFPNIRVCTTETVSTDKKPKEFTPNIMSIQNILDKRRALLSQPKRSFVTEQKKQIISDSVDSESLTFNFNNIDKVLKDISNTDVSKIMSRTKTKKSSRKGSKISYKKGSKKGLKKSK
jgi:hypothetical protein